MAVPKRKMSRSNTRHRRSQWKAVAPTLVTCANPACGAKHLPHRACGDVRPVRRPRRPSPGPLSRSRTLTNYAHAPRSARGPDPGPRAARARPDAPLVRLRERRAADQRAPGVPRRLRARRRRHRDALPHPPGPLRGPAGQAARGRRQRPRAGRGRPRHRARRPRQARPRRGDDRRPRQGLDPLRHRRGGDRRRPPQRRLRGLRPRSCTCSSTR